MKAPSARALLWTAAIGIALYAFLSLAVSMHALDEADRRVNTWVEENVGDSFLGVGWTVWTNIGAATLAGSAVAVAGFLAWRAGAARTAVIIVSFSLVGGLVVDGFKIAHHRPYPPKGIYLLDPNGADIPCPREDWCLYGFQENGTLILCPPGTRCTFLVGNGTDPTRQSNVTYVPPDLASFPPGRAPGVGGAYPSGHTMGATLAWGAALILGTRALRGRRDLDGIAVGLWAALALVGGVSRVPVHAHWWTDVAGSWLLGVALLALALLVDDRWGRRAAPILPYEPLPGAYHVAAAPEAPPPAPVAPASNDAVASPEGPPVPPGP